MSALELYAKQAIQTKGTLHRAAIESLRRYIRQTDIDEMIRYINTITDPQILRTLQEAGMRAQSYTAVIERMNLLIKEQQGGEM